MTAYELEEYICLCLEKQADLGPHYVRRQIEWAQAELEKLLEKSSSMADAVAPGGAVYPA